MNSIEVTSYKCSECGTVYLRKEGADSCCSPKLCTTCGREIPKKSYYTICDTCREKKELIAERARYDKATKCLYADYPDDEKVMLYSEIYCYNEGYFSDIDELIEYCEGEELPTPRYCWSTGIIDISMDADNLIESACEELWEESNSQIGTEEREKLQAFLDEWCAKQTGTRSYSVDYKYAIQILI